MSWPIVRIGDVFNVARGGSPRPIQDFITDKPDGINWIMIGDTQDGSKYIESTAKKIKPEGKSKSREVKPGDFLLTNSMSFGRPYILKISGCIHDGWLVLSPKEENIHTDYFYYYLGSKEVKQRLAGKAAGAVVKNLNSDIVRDLEIPLPPLAEQKRIAAILDKADAIRRKRQQAIQLADEFLRATFLDMFGDPVTNARGWNEFVLSSVADIRSGVTKGKQVKPEHAITLPYMRVANVQDGFLNLTDIQKITVSERDAEKCRLDSGDILLTEGGDPDKLGRGHVWGGEIPNCIHQNHIFSVRVKDKAKLNPYFLSALISSARGKRYFLKVGKQTTGIATINKTVLSEFVALVPPIELQERYLKVVNEIAKIKSKFDLGDLSLASSIAQKAFLGQI